MSAPIKIFIVDDQNINIEALKILFSNYPNEFEVVGSALSSKEAIEQIDKVKRLDIVLMDYRMPTTDGLETTKILLNDNRFVPINYKIAILSIVNNFALAVDATLKGANAYILRTSPFSQLTEALKNIHLKPDRIYIDPNIIRKKHTGALNLPVLSNLEKKICQGILDENTSEEIAKDLKLDVSVVNESIRDLREKTGTKNLAQLVVYILDNNLCPSFMYQRPGRPSIPTIPLRFSEILPVFIVDDDAITRDGLCFILKDAQNVKFNVLGVAGKAQDVLDYLNEHRPVPETAPILLMDLEMPDMDGLEASKYILQAYPFVRIVILTIRDSWAKAEEALITGVRAYVTKDINREDLIKVLWAVHNDSQYLGITVPEDKLKFQGEDRQIICLIAQGLTDGEIAEKIHKTAKEIGDRRTSVRRKVGCRKSVGIIIYAWLNRLCD